MQFAKSIITRQKSQEWDWQPMTPILTRDFALRLPFFRDSTIMTRWNLKLQVKLYRNQNTKFKSQSYLFN